eukprot:7569900-Ditylum_brightwellii.AAC.1
MTIHDCKYAIVSVLSLKIRAGTAIAVTTQTKRVDRNADCAYTFNSGKSPVYTDKTIHMRSGTIASTIPTQLIAPPPKAT